MQRDASEEIWSVPSISRQGPVDIFLPSAREGPLPAHWMNNLGLWGIFWVSCICPFVCRVRLCVCESAPFWPLFICFLVPFICFCLIPFLVHNHLTFDYFIYCFISCIIVLFIFNFGSGD